MKEALAVDIGGTKLAVGRVTPEGELVQRWQRPTPTTSSGTELFTALSELLDELIANPPTTKIEVPVTWRLGQTFNDAAIFLCIFVFMLAIEWGLRKKWGLV